MKVSGEIERVNLATGHRWRRLTGGGESVLVLEEYSAADRVSECIRRETLKVLAAQFNAVRLWRTVLDADGRAVVPGNYTGDTVNIKNPRSGPS